MTVRADSKVFQNGPYLMGFTTSFRMGQILRYFNPPDPEGWDLWRFMATTFVDAARKAFKDSGYTPKDSEGSEAGGSFLVGVRGQLFKVDDDFQVGVPADGFAAVGCGAPIARGALWVTPMRPPEARIRAALEAAERFSCGVRGPFVIESMEVTP
jgi:hypothetical protein